MELVKIEKIGNEDRVSHRIIADGTDNQAKNVMELINTYKNELQEFGVVAFKTEAVSEEELKANPEAKDKKTAYLNEQQATFLITLMRNNEKTVRFKLVLVKSFYEMKKLKSGKRTITKEELELKLEREKILILKEKINLCLKVNNKHQAKMIFNEAMGIVEEETQPLNPINNNFGNQYESNVVEFANKCIVRKDKSYVTVEKLYKRYIDYCKDEGLKPLSKIVFGKEVKKITDLDSEVRRIEGRSERVYLGIAI